MCQISKLQRKNTALKVCFYLLFPIGNAHFMMTLFVDGFGYFAQCHGPWPTEHCTNSRVLTRTKFEMR